MVEDALVHVHEAPVRIWDLPYFCAARAGRYGLKRLWGRREAAPLLAPGIGA